MNSINKMVPLNQKALPLAALFAALLLGVPAVGAADYPSTVLADHPIAYYRMEETSGTTVNDSSASGQFPATYNPSTDGMYPKLGQPGIDTNSIQLSTASANSTSFAYAGYYPEFNEQAPFSFEIWARPASLDSANYRCPVGNFSGWATPTQSGWYVYQTPGSPSTFAFIMAGSSVWIAYSGVTPANWFYLVGTYDGTNASFYVNGQLVGTQNAAGYEANSVNNPYNYSLGIGERGDISQFFDGNLDEFAYYTNVLTATQVLT
ncbi:MAG TPA: LamG domain-containing protein, partial [Verrucomicrobiae bacterium]|nr:LamG domain-containing protein [Verrucomicrobiae bacterium]